MSDTYYRIVDGENQPILQRLYVVKRTSKGAWLCYGWQRDRGRLLERSEMHWVGDDTRRRFAYPTIALALDSYVQRKRWQIRWARASIDKAETMLDYAERANVSDEMISFAEPNVVQPSIL